MPGEMINIQGKVKWARFVAPDKFDCWSCDIYPTAESLEVLRGLQAEGAKNVMKKDDDGYFMRIRRPVNKKMGAKMVNFTAPRVVDTNGQPADASKIGNGSDVTLKIEAYQHNVPNGGKAKAIRLEAVKIDNLVPFNPEADFSPEELASIEGLKDAKEQLF